MLGLLLECDLNHISQGAQASWTRSQRLERYNDFFARVLEKGNTTIQDIEIGKPSRLGQREIYSDKVVREESYGEQV